MSELKKMFDNIEEEYDVTKDINFLKIEIKTLKQMIIKNINNKIIGTKSSINKNLIINNEPNDKPNINKEVSNYSSVINELKDKLSKVKNPRELLKPIEV